MVADFAPAVLDELVAATDAATVRDVIAIFRADAPKILAELREAHAAGDAVRLGRLAHRFKGATGSLGLAAAQGLCQRLEQQARLGAAGCGEHLAQLGALIEGGQAGLDRYEAGLPG